MTPRLQVLKSRGDSEWVFVEVWQALNQLQVTGLQSVINSATSVSVFSTQSLLIIYKCFYVAFTTLDAFCLSLREIGKICSRTVYHCCSFKPLECKPQEGV